jgi:hypothetical protein
VSAPCTFQPAWWLSSCVGAASNAKAPCPDAAIDDEHGAELQAVGGDDAGLKHDVWSRHAAALMAGPRIAGRGAPVASVNNVLRSHKTHTCAPEDFSEPTAELDAQEAASATCICCWAVYGLARALARA